MTSAQLHWDVGTAYDLFISLAVLHSPGDFGLRGAWAAGVRARLPDAERETLEQSQLLGNVPFHWIHTLPEPKGAAAVLWTLGQIPAAERLPVLALQPKFYSNEAEEILKGASARAAWDEKDRQALSEIMCCPEKKKPPSPEKLAKILDMWAHAEEFGERYLHALRTYQESFFVEEERRIRPALQRALSRAQELAQRMELPDLLEELSQGLRFEEPIESDDEVVLAPSFWCTPLMYFGFLADRCRIYLFGARPADASLIPGETVPDALLRALKALSDPTRLRILHYLSEQPLTPAELARRLRLRAPTVTHHLKTLRLAGLVQLTLGHGKEARRYAARTESVEAAFASLQGFLKTGESNGNE